MSLTTNQAPPYNAELGLLIDGQWRRTAQRFHAVIDPATEGVIAQLPLAEAADLDDALAAAQRGFDVWRRKSAVERGGVLERAALLMHERADAIGILMSLEHGKIYAESVNEVHTSADIVKWFAEEGRRSYGRVVPGPLPNSRQLVLKLPVGPVAAFSPWNFPVRIPARSVATCPSPRAS